ncbi:hypothetical protein U1Q18_040312 [Sarracenia purpurea var. burkii]
MGFVHALRPSWYSLPTFFFCHLLVASFFVAGVQLYCHFPWQWSCLLNALAIAPFAPSNRCSSCLAWLPFAILVAIFCDAAELIKMLFWLLWSGCCCFGSVGSLFCLRRLALVRSCLVPCLWICRIAAGVHINYKVPCQVRVTLKFARNLVASGYADHVAVCAALFAAVSTGLAAMLFFL